MVEALLEGGPIKTKTGETSVAEAVKDCKLIGIYFSMHNCPPCRQFTPVFAELYNEVNSDNKVMEVIFVSGDKTQEEYDSYYGEMPWLALPRGDERLGKLAQKFNVRASPDLSC